MYFHTEGPPFRAGRRSDGKIAEKIAEEVLRKI
jgi:hypothetical protein